MKRNKYLNVIAKKYLTIFLASGMIFTPVSSIYAEESHYKSDTDQITLTEEQKPVKVNMDIQTIPFHDMKTHWAKDAVSQAYKEGWVSGFPDGNFKPSKSVTFAEFSSMLNSALELPKDIQILEKRVNVPRGHWASDKIEFLSFNMSEKFLDENELILDTPLTRKLVSTILIQHMATLTPVIYDSLTQKSYETEESFIQVPLDMSVEVGVINGTKKGLEWDRKVTRAEAVQAIINAKRNIVNILRKADSNREVWGLTFEYQQNMIDKYSDYPKSNIDLERKYPDRNDSVKDKIETIIDKAMKGNQESIMFLTSPKIVNNLAKDVRVKYIDFLRFNKKLDISEKEKEDLVKLMSTMDAKMLNDAMNDTNFFILMGFGKRETKEEKEQYNKWIKDRITGNKYYWKLTDK